MADNRAIRFGRRHVGPGYPVVVVAEIGVNHEGDAATCFGLVGKAAQAGADAIKLQTLDADENYVPGTESHAVFAKAQLTPGETAEAFRLARALGMEALTTCGDMATLAWVDKLEPAAHKISSGLVTHLPLIRAAAATGRPLVISTGMCDLALAAEAVAAARAGGARELCLLQCTSVYPAPSESLQLRGIQVLAREFGFPTGFSDHSLGNEAVGLAVAAGASMIEKHFSLDPSRRGFDHRLSVDPAGLKDLVDRVRTAESMLGVDGKSFTDEQASAGQKYLRSIVARRDIEPGDVLTLENVGFMRTLPGDRGLPPGAWGRLVGARAARVLRRYQAIRFDDIEPQLMDETRYGKA